MIGHYLTKLKKSNLFIYYIEGPAEEILDYKKLVGNYFQTEENEPLLFTNFYSFWGRPLVFQNGKYELDMNKLFDLEVVFNSSKQNLWALIAHARSKFPQSTHRKNIWTLNRNSNESYNINVHSLPLDLKNELLAILEEYEVSFSSHVYLSEEEAELASAEMIEMNCFDYDQYLRLTDLELMTEKDRDEYEQSARDPWEDIHKSWRSNINNNLDIDQQSENFWNLF